MVNPALKTVGDVPDGIEVLKSLYFWLRKQKHLFSVGERGPDVPDFGGAPGKGKARAVEAGKVILQEHYLLAGEHLAPFRRDGMDVQAGTGWHVTELVRFAKMGGVEPYRGDAEGVAGVLVCPQTKSGEPLRTAVSADVLEAGKRLLERGTFGREKYSMAVNAACKAAGILPFTSGRFRHSVATWAIKKGADPASVAALLNHKSPSTTRHFYATHAVSAKLLTLLRVRAKQHVVRDSSARTCKSASWEMETPSRSRYIATTEIKLLWAYSGGYCAFPGCRQLCVAPATNGDPAKPLGEHAHIIAHSDAGPRADPSIPESERASYSNLILLCPTHHTQIDKQPDSFTVEDLRSWKRELERWVHERLGRAVSDITFTELEQVCQYLLSPAGPPTSNFQVLPPKEKMDRNSITQRLEGYLRLGIGGSPYVERYVDHVAEIDEDFPERLKAGFLLEYRARYEQGERGDVLFASLLRFAQAGDDGLARQAAGLAVLGYLFMTCEVFES